MMRETKKKKPTQYFDTTTSLLKVEWDRWTKYVNQNIKLQRPTYLTEKKTHKKRRNKRGQVCTYTYIYISTDRTTYYASKEKLSTIYKEKEKQLREILRSIESRIRKPNHALGWYEDR